MTNTAYLLWKRAILWLVQSRHTKEGIVMGSRHGMVSYIACWVGQSCSSNWGPGHFPDNQTQRIYSSVFTTSSECPEEQDWLAAGNQSRDLESQQQQPKCITRVPSNTMSCLFIQQYGSKPSKTSTSFRSKLHTNLTQLAPGAYVQCMWQCCSWTAYQLASLVHYCVWFHCLTGYMHCHWFNSPAIGKVAERMLQHDSQRCISCCPLATPISY